MTAFIAKKIKNRFVQHFHAPYSKVSPLLCPVREYEWIEPWQCEMLHSDSGFAEKNCVFRTDAPGEPPDDTNEAYQYWRDQNEKREVRI